jgi:hypothetical protein
VSRKGAGLVLLLAGLLVTVVWRVAPAASPPIYDGICLADPYRALGSSPAPTSATKMYAPVTAGNFPTSEVVTTDNPPQTQLLLVDGTFVSSEPFTITITPIPPPGPQPSDGSIDGNVYRIVAMTVSGKQLNPVDAAHNATLLLRGTSMNPARTMERLDGTTWTDLKTLPAGCGDTFEAATPRLGDFALVVPKQGGSGGGGGGGSGTGPPVVPIVIGLVVIVLATTLGLIRLNRTRSG